MEQDNRTATSLCHSKACRLTLIPARDRAAQAYSPYEPAERGLLWRPEDVAAGGFAVRKV